MMRKIPLRFVLIAAAAGTVLVAACQDGRSQSTILPLRNPEMRSFAEGLMLTRGDVPDAVEDAPEDAWLTDPIEGQAGLPAPVDAAGDNYLGTYVRSYFVRSESGPTFALANMAILFRTAESAAAVMASFQSTDIREFNADVLSTTYSGDVNIADVTSDAGEARWGWVITGAGILEEAPADLLNVYLAFQRGPIIGIITISGFVPLDQTELERLASVMDERIQEALEKL